MNKYLLLLLILSTFRLNGQVHDLYESDFIIVGPENIDYLSASLRDDYIENYTELILVNNAFLHELETDFELEDEKEQKKIKKRIERLNEENKIIENYIALWETTFETHYPKMLAFYEDYQNISCLEIIGTKETLQPEQYKFVLNEDKEDWYREIIYIKEIPGDKEWVRRKIDKNCVSLNPDDCYVACMVEKMNPVLLFNDKTIDFEKCPADFTFSEEEKFCYREQQLFTEDKSLALNLIKLETKEPITDIVKWEKTNCK